jgi:hypothetical protein
VTVDLKVIVDCHWRSMLKPHAATEPIGSFFDNPDAGSYSLRVGDEHAPHVLARCSDGKAILRSRAFSFAADFANLNSSRSCDVKLDCAPTN